MTGGTGGGRLPGPFYHGTTAPGLARLEPSREGLFGSGVYASSDADDAAGYGPYLAVVRLRLERPRWAEADYSVAERYGCDSPAGPLVLQVLGEEQGGALLRRLAHRPFGLIGGELEEALRRLGHDGLVVRWPSGVLHAVAFEPGQVEVEGWTELWGGPAV